MSSRTSEEGLKCHFCLIIHVIPSSDSTELREAVHGGCLGKHGTVKQEGTDGVYMCSPLASGLSSEEVLRRQRGHGLHTEAVEFQRSAASPTHQDCCIWGLPFLSSVTASATEAPSHYSVCFHHPNRHCASTACPRNVCRLNS